VAKVVLGAGLAIPRRCSRSVARGRTGAALALGGSLAVLVATGCNAILDFGGYTVVADAGTDGGVDARHPRDGSHDVGTHTTRDARHDAPLHKEAGADACGAAPTNRETLERACTSATCVPFDESRVPAADGGLRQLPPFTPDGGVADAERDAPHDARVRDAGRHDAHARDAQPGDAHGDARDAEPHDAHAHAEDARADAPSYPRCAAQPNVVYATGSSALSVLLAAVAQSLAGNITFVYQTTASCVGVQSVLDDSYRMTGTAVYYTSTGAEVTCALPDAGVPADIGISDVFASTCQALPNGLPETISENLGPVQVMTLSVPATSTQTSISLAAAYDVFGFGSRSMVAPWTNGNQIFQRGPSSGTQNMIAATIGVPAYRWQGITESETSTMLAALQAAGKEASPTPDQTIGILVAGSADPNRSTIRVLAFQDQDQSCGYYPDSTATAFDKYNVRNGHYPIWGPSHFYNRVNGSVPLKPNAQTFINDLSGITPLPGVDLLALYAQNRVIPLCAMHVQRMSDGANYTPYTPSTSCNCYYDAQAIGQTSCKTCSGPTDCPASAPACNKFNNQPMGYCEPQ